MIEDDKSHLFKNPDNIVRVTNYVIIYEGRPYDLYMAIYIKKRTIRRNYIFKDGKFLRIYRKKFDFCKLMMIKDAKIKFPHYFI